MKVLMVSTEYPPMSGGVGRYTSHLVESLRKVDVEVLVACNDRGDGEFFGLSPTNKNNSDKLLSIVDRAKPDVVHVQFEPGLYGLVMDARDPLRCDTYIDSFYRQCKVPLVTTFHTGHTLRQWLSQASYIKSKGRSGQLGIPARAAVRLGRHLLNYRAFCQLNMEKAAYSKVGITFSRHLADMLDRKKCQVIYHGSDPALPPMHKSQAREYFGLPKDCKLALATGFRTATKGWDILEKLNLPENWKIITNSSRGHYSTEAIGPLQSKKMKNAIIDLERGYLCEEEISLLFYSADILLLPYRVTAGSGVMFDGIAHGLPFVASNLPFFEEYAELGLGITRKRDPKDFAAGIMKLDSRYESYRSNILKFQSKLRWQLIAQEHLRVYNSAVTPGMEVLR